MKPTVYYDAIQDEIFIHRGLIEKTEISPAKLKFHVFIFTLFQYFLWKQRLKEGSIVKLGVL